MRLTWAAAFATALGSVVLDFCSPPPPPPHPVVIASANRHDFGPLWIGEARQQRFTIRNDGGKQLVLDPVRSSCGCLVASLAKNRLAPGETTELVAEIHADRGPAQLDKYITVGTNDPAVAWLPFQLLTETRALYAYSPPMIDLQALVLGDPFEIEVPITMADGNAVHFGTPKTPIAGFSSRLKGIEPGVAATSVTLVVRFDGASRPGRTLFHVTLPSDHPLVARANITIQSIVNPRLVSQPADLLDFGAIARADGALREVIVRSRAKEPLAIAPTVKVETSIVRRPDAVDLPDVTASLVEQVAGREWKLTATVAPGSAGKVIVGRIVVSVDLEGEPPLSLTLAGRLLD
ncbi:MAG: DUF1573 domain-containing protein [Myxococcales bacterium]|nr:DUF1573 domain-containing protein [Myxococcales bacterium]